MKPGDDIPVPAVPDNQSGRAASTEREDPVANLVNENIRALREIIERQVRMQSDGGGAPSCAQTWAEPDLPQILHEISIQGLYCCRTRKPEVHPAVAHCISTLSNRLTSYHTAICIGHGTYGTVVRMEPAGPLPVAIKMLLTPRR